MPRCHLNCSSVDSGFSADSVTVQLENKQQQQADLLLADNCLRAVVAQLPLLSAVCLPMRHSMPLSVS